MGGERKEEEVCYLCVCKRDIKTVKLNQWKEYKERGNEVLVQAKETTYANSVMQIKRNKGRDERGFRNWDRMEG